ncbi:MAG: hypothetical protein KDA22_09920, partial [Phycisphaerales bacterium]|nr:hypothetical protein [Phycisphaerales bacterium]
ALRDGMPPWAEPSFDRTADDEVVLQSELLDRIRFLPGDMLTCDLPSAPYDLVLCRNLAIYLSDSAQRRLVDRLAGVMTEDALLLVGHADAVMSLLDRFERVDPAAFAFRTRARRGAIVPIVPDARKLRTGTSPVRRPPDAPSATALTSPSFRTRPARAEPEPAGRSDRKSIAETIETNEPRAVEAAARAVLQSKPDDIPAMLALVEQRLAQDPDEAERLCRRIVYLDARQERALMVLADLADRRGRIEEANRFRRRAMRAHLENWNEPEGEGGASAKDTGLTT